MSEEAHKGLGEAIQGRVAGFVGSLRFWGLFVGVIASYPVLHVFLHPLECVIPILDEVPGFRLEDALGSAVGLWDDTEERKVVDTFCVEAAKGALRTGPASCKNMGMPEDVVVLCAKATKDVWWTILTSSDPADFFCGA